VAIKAAAVKMANSYEFLMEIRLEIMPIRSMKDTVGLVLKFLIKP
jgi:hypothetical protein